MGENGESSFVSLERSFKIMKGIIIININIIIIKKKLLEIFLFSNILNLLSFIDYCAICHKNNLNNSSNWSTLFWKIYISNKKTGIHIRNLKVISRISLQWGREVVDFGFIRKLFQNFKRDFFFTLFKSIA